MESKWKFRKQFLSRWFEQGVTETNERVYLILKATVVFFFLFRMPSVIISPIYDYVLLVGLFVASFPNGSHSAKEAC